MKNGNPTFPGIVLGLSLWSAGPANSQTQVEAQLASPFHVVGTTEAALTVRYTPESFQELLTVHRTGSPVRIHGFSLPDHGTVDLVLRPVHGMEPGGVARVVDAQGESSLAPTGVHFSGYVADHGGHAFVSVSPGQTNGYLQIDDQLYFLASGDAQPGMAYVSSARGLQGLLADMPQVETWCRVVSQQAGMDPIEAPETQTLGTTNVHRGDFFLELDNAFRNQFANDQSALDYADTLLAATREIYRRDLGTVIRVPSGYIRLWNVTPPWGVITTFNDIGDVQNWWTDAGSNPDVNLPRASVHVLTNPVFGGVAWDIGGICDNSRGYEVSSVFGSFPFPIQHTSPNNWDLVVFTHEYGHSFGSPHTFNYSPEIDCVDGSGPDNGTIMSYCHLEPGGINNVGIRFHERVQDVIRNYVDGRACMTQISIDLGDYDHDGDRDAADLVSFDAYQGQGFVSRGYEETFDMNNDGTVDTCDRDILSALINFDPASATSYNGTGVNVPSYTTPDVPILGQDWLGIVGAFDHPGAHTTFIQGQSAPAAGPVLGIGELLIDVTSDFHFLHSVSGGGANLHFLSIPNDKSLAGLRSYTQGIIFGGGYVELTNAIELHLNFDD